MGKFILGVIIGLLIIPIGVCVYFYTGMVPVATSAQAMPFEKTMARIGLAAHVKKEAPKNAPFQPSEGDYMSGAMTYHDNCAVCHGSPGQAETAVAKGMFPKPPQLFHGDDVTDDPPGVTYWKVANGIRLTGMPGFKQSLSEKELWQVSFLLANADKLPDSAKQQLGETQPATPTNPAPTTKK